MTTPDHPPGSGPGPGPGPGLGPGRARFITVEGGEGAGKSTQAARLRDALEGAGQRVVLTREPGGTMGAEALRALLLDPAIAWAPQAEMLLHFAARADHVAGVIRPALAEGSWVVSDRFFDSTMVYQGFGQAQGRSAARQAIRQLTSMLGLIPDLTLVLDVPVEISLRRLSARLAQGGGDPDRYERLGADFFARVRDGFRAVAREAPARCVLLDATADADDVAATIWDIVRTRLPVPAHPAP